MKSTLLLVGGALPVVSLASAVSGLLSFDVAISTISVLFIIALVPGIIENYRRKIGWSKQSTVMTGSGLLSMGTMFVMVGLPLTGLLTFLSGTMWVILAVQAFIYGSATEASNTPKVLEK